MIRLNPVPAPLRFLCRSVNTRHTPPKAMSEQPTFTVGPDFEPRLEGHYRRTLRKLLLSANYEHEVVNRASKNSNYISNNQQESSQLDPDNQDLTLDSNADTMSLQRRQKDPLSPYSANSRALPKFGGGHFSQRPTAVDSVKDIPALKKIVLHVFTGVQPGFDNATMQLHSIGGIVRQVGDANNKNSSVSCPQTVRAKRSISQYNLRAGNKVGSVLTLTGHDMWQFIDILADFVLPRITDFSGFRLPPPDISDSSPQSHSGVVEFIVPEDAMQFFPQITPAFDSYSRLFKMYVQFVTNQSGPGATAKARLLMSSLRIPFCEVEALSIKRDAAALKREQFRLERSGGQTK